MSRGQKYDLDTYVSPTTSAVLEDPVLNGSTLGLSENALLRTISPGDAVDLPFASLALELELVLDSGVCRREGNVAELQAGGHGRNVALGRVADDETHNLVGARAGC